MEDIIEFILELILEGGIEASKNKKIPKFIRYPLILITILFFIAIIGLIFFVGIMLLKDSIIGGIFIISIGVFMFIDTIIRFKKEYLIKKEKKLNL